MKPVYVIERHNAKTHEVIAAFRNKEKALDEAWGDGPDQPKGTTTHVVQWKGCLPFTITIIEGNRCP